MQLITVGSALIIIHLFTPEDVGLPAVHMAMVGICTKISISTFAMISLAIATIFSD